MKYIKIITFLLLSIACKGASFDKFFPNIIKVEGILFTVTKYDKGGATKFGVTYATFKSWCKEIIVVKVPCDKDLNGKITKNDLRLTVLNDVKPIYKAFYWDVVNADYINNQRVAELFVDFIINSGCGYKNKHIKVIQKIVGVKADGKIGEKTLKAINSYNQKELYIKLYKYRINYYYSIAHGGQRNNLEGWLNRMLKIKSIHQNYQMT